MPAAHFLANPESFLQCISDARISYTFAPNFFLGMIVEKLQRGYSDTAPSIQQSPGSEAKEEASKNPSTKLKLSSLRALISGGEANVVKTCVALQDLLAAYGAPEAFIRPGFGMTETCAGSIYK